LPWFRRRADVVIRRASLAVFVDGCFWHGCPEHSVEFRRNGAWWREKIRRNQVRDADTDDVLRAHGWHVVRIWEHDLPERAVKTIARLVRERAPKRKRRRRHG
jgi:DNA mismatch endonuclease (patch repair protein)